MLVRSFARLPGSLRPLLPCVGLSLPLSAFTHHTAGRCFSIAVASRSTSNSVSGLAASLASPAAWDASAAAGYDESLFGHFCAGIANQVVVRHSASDSVPQHLLDAGAGTGVLALALADKYPSAVIEACDLSPLMVHTLSARIPSSHNTTLTASVQDIMRLPAGWSSRFDASFCNLALMFVPQPALALAELARVTKPGGVAVVTVWSTLRDCPALTISYEAIEAAVQAQFARASPTDAAAQQRKRDHVPVPLRPHPNFSLAHARQLKQDVLSAGFASCNVAKLYATFNAAHTEFVPMALRSFAHTFPDKSNQFKEDFSAALQQAVVSKSGGQLRVCVNVAVAVR